MSAKNKVIIFVGPPGSGKGSLSQLCVSNFGWKQLSTGFLCRKHISEKTEIGKEIDFSIKSGKLISDKLVVEMVEQWLLEPSQQKASIILDGFPRNRAQATALRSILEKKIPAFTVSVFKLYISDEIVQQRILSRFICENKECQAVFSKNEGGLRPHREGICNECSSALIRRSDDQEETIIQRLETYRNHEKDLLDYFQKNEFSINEINVDKPLNSVFEDFKLMVTGSLDDNN